MAVPQAITTLPSQASQVLHQVGEQVRDHVPEELPDRLRARAAPQVRRSRIAGWELVRAAVDAAIGVLRWVVRALSSASTVAEDVTERGERFAGQARSVVAALPTRQQRRRQRQRIGIAAAAGFAIGVVTGIVVAVRSERLRGHDASLDLPATDAPSRPATDASPDVTDASPDAVAGDVDGAEDQDDGRLVEADPLAVVESNGDGVRR